MGYFNFKMLNAASSNANASKKSFQKINLATKYYTTTG